VVLAATELRTRTLGGATLFLTRMLGGGAGGAAMVEATKTRGRHTTFGGGEGAGAEMDILGV
jgi:hypothetical protein